MSGQIAVHGRLVAEPTSRTTKNDNLMATARLAVSLPCHGTEDGYLTMWLGVVAFGKQADFLMRHDKGGLVSVSGSLQMNQWTGQDGAQQTGYQVVVDSVVSARTVRPGANKKAGGQGGVPARSCRWRVTRMLARRPHTSGKSMQKGVTVTGWISGHRLMMCYHPER